MKIDLTGKTALITGASRGVGRAAAYALSAAGARCLLMARDNQALDELTAALPNARAISVDLSDASMLQGSLQAIEEHVDIFIHSASPMFPYTKLHELTPTTLQEQMSVNVYSAVALCEHLLPQMMLKRWGRVILVGSLGGRLGGQGAAAYNMAKASQESLARSIAIEYGRYHICANTLVLAPIDDERLSARDLKSPGARARMLERSPHRRLPTSAQVADLITFFASDYIAPVNGATLDVSCAIHLNAAW